MSFAASTMWAAIGVPTTKAPINVTTFLSYILPPVLFYFVMAVLAIKPQTRALRVALWPVIALLAFRAAFSVDMALSSFERKFHNDLAVSGSFEQSFSNLSRARLNRLVEPYDDACHPFPLLGVCERAARETAASCE